MTSPTSVLGIGLNYRDHIAEAGERAPTHPFVFSKLASSVIGDGEPIVVDRALTVEVDWEVELACVIGRRMRNVDVADALEYVAGYAVANDVTARDIQRAEPTLVRAKGLDTFCPLGRTMPASKVSDPQRLALQARLNGSVVQDSTTSQMIFGVAELLAYCSTSFTLHPGDVILTGTPAGCGAFGTPPRYLAHGDVIEVEVEGLGVLRNSVIELDGSSRGRAPR